MNKRKVPKIRFKGFHDDWEQRKVSDLAEKTYGGGTPTTSNEAYWNGDIPWIQSSDVVDGKLLGVEPRKWITQDGLNNSAAQLIPGNSIAIITRVGVGKLAFMPYSYATSQDFLSLSKLNAEPLFAVYACYKKLQSVMNAVQGTSIKGITKDELLAKNIMVPRCAEQQQIGAFFKHLDHLITLHQRKLELLKRLRNSLVDRCFIGEKCTMSKLILYHGSPNRVIVPKLGFGEDRHDHGRGFYLTENLELAKEWAVCRPDETNGWVHKYELEMEGLNILDFQKYDVLSWLAELMKHRDAADSRRYKMLAQKFIEKYGIDTCGYDVITGWRANASYFYIAKEFVRDNIDIEILEELLSLGGLGIQFCIKSERAFAQLSEVEQDIMSVDYSEFNDRYNSGTTICRAARS